MNGQETTAQNRATMTNILAVVGFVALIGASMWLAVYSTRFVPGVVSRLGSAAVYLGSVFIPSSEPTLSVVPTPVASVTIPFGDAIPAVAETPKKPATPIKQIAPTAGQKTTNTYQISGAATMPTTLSGLSDLIVTINAVGYLTTSSPDSFVASSTVPAGGRAAVNFTIKNIGTNVVSPWRFSATIPTQSSYLYYSQPQQLLAPGDSIDYTLGFDQAYRGADQMVSVTANFDHMAAESNFNNNSASTKITILGS